MNSHHKHRHHISHAREETLKVLYSHELHHITISTDDSIANDYVNNIIENTQKIDEYIKKYARNRHISQINLVILLILRIGIYELKFARKTDAAVIINEAIELAKRYSDQKSARFVNAILDNVARDES